MISKKHTAESQREESRREMEWNWQEKQPMRNLHLNTTVSSKKAFVMFVRAFIFAESD